MKNKLASRSQFSIVAFYLLILSIGIISCLVRIRWNGLIYNFDFGIYQPDGAHYTYQTLRFLGHPPQEANDLVFNWYSTHASKAVTFTNTSLVRENNPLWGLIAPRLLYPILSMPFVFFLGIPGMLAIPIASFLLVLIIIGRIGLRLDKPILSILLIVFYSASPTILRWMISNCTDSLLTFFFVLSASVLFYWRGRTRDFLTIFILILLTGLTRISITIWVPLLISLFLYKKTNLIRTTSLLLTSGAVFIPTLYFSLKVPEENSSGALFSRVMLLIQNFVKASFYEIAELLVLDRIFAMLLFLAVLISLIRWRRFSSGIFLASLAGVWILTAINPVLGVNFRYQLPIIGFMGILLLENFAEITFQDQIRLPNWFRGIFVPTNLAPNRKVNNVESRPLQ